jgi:hypothetical protein
VRSAPGIPCSLIGGTNSKARAKFVARVQVHAIDLDVSPSFETAAFGGLLRMRSAQVPHGEEAHRAVSNHEARARA